MTPFADIYARAADRKGGKATLERLLHGPKPDAELAALADDRVLAEMTRRIFSAGFVWSVINDKWEGFEEAFLGFESKTLLFQPDEFWHDLTRDTRIVRNGQKIMQHAEFFSRHHRYDDGRFQRRFQHYVKIAFLALGDQDAYLRCTDGNQTGYFLEIVERLPFRPMDKDEIGHLGALSRFWGRHSIQADMLSRRLIFALSDGHRDFDLVDCGFQVV